MSSSESHRPDIAVVGGGVIGLAITWRAVRRGLRVVLLDRGELGGATSHVAAGMLAPVAEAAFGEEPLLALNLESAERYPAWAAELAADARLDPGLRRSGALLVARDRDAAAALERELAFRESLGLAVERLLPSEARHREPALAPTIRAAASLPDDHAVDPRALTAALASAARRAGADLRPHQPVAGVELEGGAVAGVRLAGGELLRSRAVVVCAGVWSADLDGLPDEARVPVRPVKGQVLRLRDPAGPGLLERVLRTEEAYVVPRGDGGYVVGATVEERGRDTAVTAGAVHDLLRAAGEVLPGVWELELEEASAGLRPGTPDNAPAIGPGALDGLHWAVGHYRHGVLLAPLTADTVLAGILGEDAPAAARPFAAARFAAGVAA